MQDQRGLSAERARQEVLASCCQAVIRRADCWGGVGRDGGGGGLLRAPLQEPLESRAEHSVLMISVCCVRVCIYLYVMMVWFHCGTRPHFMCMRSLINTYSFGNHAETKRTTSWWNTTFLGSGEKFVVHDLCVCIFISINGCPLLRVCVQGVCLFTAVCVHLGWVNAEHKFRVWVTILGHMSCHFHLLHKNIPNVMISMTDIQSVNYVYIKERPKDMNLFVCLQPSTHPCLY